MNITRMHVLGQGTRVYQEGKEIPNVLEINTPFSRDAQYRTSTWFIHDISADRGRRNPVKMDDLDTQFTLIFTDRFGNHVVLWSNEPVEQQKAAWNSKAEFTMDDVRKAVMILANRERPAGTPAGEANAGEDVAPSGDGQS